MTDDDDMTLIIRAASMPPDQAGQELLRLIVNYSLALGYTANVRPETIAATALWNCATTIGAHFSDAEWSEVQMRIANLLEQQAHEEAA